MKEVNIRLRSWFGAMKKMGVLKKQGDLSEYIKTTEDKPMKQEYLSYILTGKRTLSDHVADQIFYHFPFITREFLFNGEGSMIYMKEMMKWLLGKTKMTQKELSKELKIPASTLNKYDNSTEFENWNIVFRYFNKITGFNVSAEAIDYANKNIGEVEPKFQGKNPQTIRFIEIIDELKKDKVINSVTEFCKIIGILPQMINNMKSGKVKQSVTMEILAKTAKHYPRVNMNYILTGDGDMYNSPGSAFGVISDLRTAQISMQHDLIDIKEALKKLS